MRIGGFVLSTAKLLCAGAGFDLGACAAAGLVGGKGGCAEGQYYECGGCCDNESPGFHWFYLLWDVLSGMFHGSCQMKTVV